MTAGRIVFGLEYDGGGFCGWQSQRCGGGVQDAVQRALFFANGAPVIVHAAGRTDSGVHATMQIIHFDAKKDRPAAAWMGAANGVLPRQIRVLWAHNAGAADFHARYSAVRRHYQYAILNRPHASALWRDFSAFCDTPLSLAALREGLAGICGRHDFSAFRAAACGAKTPVRTVQAAARRRGEFILLDFYADGFLHRMVRNITGALLEVGKGKKPPQWIKELLAQKERRLCPKPAPASGLYFTGAEYPPDYNFIPPPRGFDFPAAE